MHDRTRAITGTTGAAPAAAGCRQKRAPHAGWAEHLHVRFDFHHYVSREIWKLLTVIILPPPRTHKPARAGNLPLSASVWRDL